MLTSRRLPTYAHMESNPVDRDTQFVALLTEAQLPLSLYVRSLLPGNEMAKDIAQQANMKIWEKRDDFELGSNFKAWAFSIARYEVLSYRKQSARDARLTFSDDLQNAITHDLLSTQGNIAPMQEALQGCLSQLKPADRQLLLHRYAKPGTLAEYARQAGRSVGGLKVTLHRLRSRLLDCIHRKINLA